MTIIGLLTHRYIRTGEPFYKLRNGVKSGPWKAHIEGLIRDVVRYGDAPYGAVLRWCIVKNAAGEWIYEY